MGFGEPFGSPFYSGGGASTLVPSQRHVGIGGRAYMLDTSEGPGWLSEDVPTQRAQADLNADPSDATLNTEALWRRTWRSWHLGSGQEFADRPDSSRERFSESSGLDVWTRHRLTPLRDTDLVLPTANPLAFLAVAAGRLYVTDGQVVRYTTDLVSWTAITGNPAQTALGIATDGSTVYVAYGSSGGLWSVAAGAAAMTLHSTGTLSGVAYAKGRLLAAEVSTGATRVYNVTASGGAVTAGTLLLTLPTGGVLPLGQWAAEGPSAIYVGATVGDKARLWRTTVEQDGATMDVAIPAGELPDGQVVRSLQGYLGAVLAVGTDDKVWDLGFADDAGNLVVRGSIPTVTGCHAMEPQDRFLWYGGAGAALGRMDLATNTASDTGGVAHAYAPDLDAALPGHTYSAVTYQGRRVLTVSGQGVYAESEEDFVASGTLDLGSVEYGIGDLKNVLFADIRHLPLADGDSVTLEVSSDGGPYSEVGGSALPGSVSATVSLGQRLAERVNLRLTLTGSPVLTMLTLRAIPAPEVGERTRLRLQLFRTQKDLAGNTFLTDAPAEVEALRRLRERKTAVLVQVGGETFPAIVDRVVRVTPHSEAKGENGSWLGWWNCVADVDVIRVEE